MKREKTLIFIPTYNEALNVGPMCEELTKLNLDADILFMDDNSPDGTGEKLDELAQRFPRVSVVHRPEKKGIGAAHLAGIDYAYEHRYDVLVTMDCDFTHSPSDIPKLLAKLDEADLVVGSRWQESNSLPGWSIVRRGLTNLGHLLTVNMLGISGDATGAFRAYRLKNIRKDLFSLVKARGYAFFFESLFIAHENHLRIVDVPIILPARTYGSSKMNMAEIQRSVGQLAQLYLARKVNPAQFRMGSPVTDINEKITDDEGWDEYWERKADKPAMAYEVVAAVYRNLIIKSNLNRVLRKHFAPGSKVLHAGCGSGQVDTDLHDHLRITAVDISLPALKLYRRENPAAEEVKHASIFELPFEDETFDGAYNLGVVEHFDSNQVKNALSEMRRVTKRGGKVVVFWPHKYASSVMVLNGIHKVMHDVMKSDKRLHPPEISLVKSREEAKSYLEAAGFDMVDYTFGPRDLFVQAVVVGERR